MLDKLHVVSFSGGKDSTAMLLMMLERGMPVDEIVFCDTGKEFPAMYDHIAEVERYTGRKITKLQAERGFDYWFKDHVITRGKWKGWKGWGWPGYRFRWCTSRLKVDVINKYFKGKNTVHYIGIAADESQRCKGNGEQYPLVGWGITEPEALQYCYDKGFDWGGLYEQFCRVSCYLCPFQRIGKLKVLYTHYPELWAEMQKLDKYSRIEFKHGYPLDELTAMFAKETGIVHKI
jgi:3'-phosphoadenosine 5'-phosphosulfate sulfotransferase (PAPS reductase)/FAD synthetase